jgi:hypothetical protein
VLYYIIFSINQVVTASCLQHLAQDVHPRVVVGGARLHLEGHAAEEGVVDVHRAVSGSQHDDWRW